MQKKGGTEELPSDKRRRIGSDRVERQGRARVPFGALNSKTDANDVGGAEGSECSTVDFTKEDVEALLNEKMKKGNQFDNKKKMEQIAELIKRLKLCVRWFKRVEEGYIQEKEKLQTDLESADKKCIDTGYINPGSELVVVKANSSLMDRNQLDSGPSSSTIKKEPTEESTSYILLPVLDGSFHTTLQDLHHMSSSFALKVGLKQEALYCAHSLHQLLEQNLSRVAQFNTLKRENISHSALLIILQCQFPNLYKAA